MKLAAVSIALITLASPVLAQSIGEALPGRGDGTGKQRFDPARQQHASHPCPEYGPGWVRLHGSSTCVRVGGSVRVDVGKSSRNGYGSSTGGLVQLETRSETTLGPVRSVVRMQGQVNRNLDSGSYPYRW